MIFTTSDENRRFCDVIIKHGTEELSWDASYCHKATKMTVAEVFKEFNGYLAKLSLHRQDQIFEVYKQIHEVITDVYRDKPPMEKLIALTKQLYLQMPMVELSAWVDNPESQIRLPLVLMTEYGDQPKARTYLKEDYRELIVFSLALRAMVPIWGEFICSYSNEVGSWYKETAAMRVMLNTWVNNSKPRARLLEYLENIIPKEPKNHSALIGGLGSTEMPEWFLSLACVRRLCITPLTSTDDKSELITSVYNFIVTNMFNSMDRKFRSMVVEKHRIQPHGEDNTSLVENYKVKQQLSDGDLTMLSVYTEFTEDNNPNSNRLIMAEKIDPSISYDLVERCVGEISKIINHPILLHHTTLTQYVVNAVIPAAGVENLNRQALLRAMTVTQAVLWHWGFYDLAVLMTAKIRNSNNESMFGGESRPRIPKETVERLVDLYPYYQSTGGKVDAVTIEKQQRQNNVVIKAIDSLSKEMNSREWELFAPIELVRLSSAPKGTRRMQTPVDFKTQLANLCIKIATRKEWYGQ